MNSNSKRLMPTPSQYAKEHLYYVQEIGTLTSQSPHISTRNNIYSFLFLIVINGSGTFTYKGVHSHIQKGDCVFIDCKNKYAHESSEEDPWTLTWVHFYGKHIYELMDYYHKLDLPAIFHPGDLSSIQLLLQTLYSVIDTHDALSEISANKYLTDIITYSFTESKPADNAVTLSEKLHQIREYLQTNYQQKLSLDNIASHFFISKFHLSREYKKQFGITLMNDLTHIRISVAKSQLRFSSDGIELIAQSCGFSDSAYFIKVFKNAENMTPLSYRKKWQ